MVIKKPKITRLPKNPNEHFDFVEFLRLKTRYEILDYCKYRLPCIGYGTGRVVFRLDTDNVIKIAINSFGISQNKNEIKANNLYTCFAPIRKKSEDCKWLTAQYFEKAKSKDFEDILGCNFEETLSFLKGEKEIEAPRFLLEIKRAVTDGLTDYSDISAWGKTPDGKELVILDYGLK